MYSNKFAAKLMNIRRLCKENVRNLSIFMVLSTHYPTFRILKQYPPYTIRTQIWKIEDYPQLIGYGTCGISNENGETQDTGDLMVFYSNNKWKTITVFYFVGLAKPEFRDEAFRYVASIV